MPRERLVGPFPAGVVPEDYDRMRREVLWRMPTGLYLLGSRSGERRNLMTCNWVTQVSLEPKLLAVAVESTAYTHELVHSAGAFGLALLDREQRPIVRKFSKPATDDPLAKTLNGLAYVDGKVTGVPIPADALAFIECSLVRDVDCGTHTLFLGEVVDAGHRGSLEELAAAQVLRMEDTRMSYGG